MPGYRVCVVGSDGHFFDYTPLECADDAEGTEQARQLVDGHDIELWQRARKSRRLTVSLRPATSLARSGDDPGYAEKLHPWRAD
jgi:hypothetical protein